MTVASVTSVPSAVDHAHIVAKYAYLIIPMHDPRRASGILSLTKLLKSTISEENLATLHTEMEAMRSANPFILDQLRDAGFSPLQVVKYIASTDELNAQGVPPRSQLMHVQAKKTREHAAQSMPVASALTPPIVFTGALCALSSIAMVGVDVGLTHSIANATSTASTVMQNVGAFLANHFEETWLQDMLSGAKKIAWGALGVLAVKKATALYKEGKDLKQSSEDLAHLEDHLTSTLPPALAQFGPQFNSAGLDDKKLLSKLMAIPQSSRVLLNHLHDVELLGFVQGDDEQKREILHRHPPSAQAELRNLMRVEGFSFKTVGNAYLTLERLGDQCVLNTLGETDDVNWYRRALNAIARPLQVDSRNVRTRLEERRLKALGVSTRRSPVVNSPTP